MKTSSKPFLKTILGFLTIIILLLTSCKEEEADPQLPILFIQVVLEESKQDLFELDSYSLDETEVYLLYQNERRELLIFYKYYIDTSAFIGLPYLQNDSEFIFDYGIGDTDTLEWNVLNDPEPGAQDDLYAVYFNGEIIHEIQMSQKLLNDMARTDPAANIIYPMIKK